MALFTQLCYLAISIIHATSLASRSKKTGSLKIEQYGVPTAAKLPLIIPVYMMHEARSDIL